MENKIHILEVGSMRINVMGTLSVMLKAPRFRNFEEFTVYPLHPGAERLILQSSKRIAAFDPHGIGRVSKSYSGGAYFHHLSIAPTTKVRFAASDWKQLTDYLQGTESPNAGRSFVKSDNSGVTEFLRPYLRIQNKA